MNKKNTSMKKSGEVEHPISDAVDPISAFDWLAERAFRITIKTLHFHDSNIVVSRLRPAVVCNEVDVASNLLARISCPALCVVGVARMRVLIVLNSYFFLLLNIIECLFIW